MPLHSVGPMRKGAYGGWCSHDDDAAVDEAVTKRRGGPEEGRACPASWDFADLAMQVGNHLYFVPFANLAKGAKKKVRVDYNDTYQEFLMGVDKAGNKLIVTSDECCDFKRITITESDDGKFDVQREPRWHHPSNSTSASSADSSHAAKKPSGRSSWRFWKS